MKTPIQQIYDHLKATKEGRGYGAEYCIDWLLENESKMLEKEKEVIINARLTAPLINSPFESDYKKEAEQYYNKTFNTKER